jgi:hypothetical protein
MNQIAIRRMIIILIVFMGCYLRSSSLEKEMQSMGEAYGYIMGQKMMLEKIKENYPDLNVNVIQAEYKFKSSFKKAEENLERGLKDLMGEYYNEFMKNYEVEIGKM